jgi:hypothetical protein
MPPERLGQFGEDGSFPKSFAPAMDVWAWLVELVIDPNGRLHNPDHAHLLEADVAALWAASGFERQGNLVLGTAEELTFRCNAWQRGRQEQQFTEWFGRVPAFLITLDASYCRQCSDAEFLALAEHELYHIAQKRDSYGAPMFTKEGQPKLTIRGHDVEEFVGVVRRYGAVKGRLAELVAAANTRPEVAGIDIARACGTCQLRAA